MIKNIGTIAVYVEDQAAAKNFWTEKLGFVTLVEDQMSPHQFWIEVAPSEASNTRLLIYNKDMMLEYDELEVCHPSIVFECDNIDAFYHQLKEKKVEVGELREMHLGKVFELKDNEKNSYLIRETISR